MTEQDFGATADRCVDVDPDAGQCQLVVGHTGPHAASVGDAYLTWEDGRIHGWSIELPPSWLIDLPWTAQFHPPAAPTPTTARTDLATGQPSVNESRIARHRPPGSTRRGLLGRLTNR